MIFECPNVHGHQVNRSLDNNNNMKRIKGIQSNRLESILSYSRQSVSQSRCVCHVQSIRANEKFVFWFCYIPNECVCVSECVLFKLNLKVKFKICFIASTTKIRIAHTHTQASKRGHQHKHWERQTSLIIIPLYANELSLK